MRYNLSMNTVFVSRSGDGHINLATDEYLLEQYRSGKMTGITLYFYVNSNAVIIGRNQNAWRECNIERMEADGVQLVRRHTGGGAVYHDGGNLNFSFISNEKLYDKDRQNLVIIRACKRLGINAEVNGRNDITVDGRKFSGCAYGISGIARAMHGTLLISSDMSKLANYLNPSKKKLAAKGITSVRSRVINLTEKAPVTVEAMRELVIEEFEREYGSAERLIFDDAAQEAISRLTDRQRSWEWRFGQSPNFDYAIDDRFSFGEMQILMHLKNGCVDSVKVYTDALSADLSDEISRLLTGVRFSNESLSAALRIGGSEACEIADYIDKEDNKSNE